MKNRHTRNFIFLALLYFFYINVANCQTFEIKKHKYKSPKGAIRNKVKAPNEPGSEKQADKLVFEIGKEFLKDKIYILNDSNTEISFLLGVSTENMRIIKLAQLTEWISESLVSPQIILIYSSSSTTPSNYTLDLGNMYRIYWDKSSNKWDLVLIPKKVRPSK